MHFGKWNSAGWVTMWQARLDHSGVYGWTLITLALATVGIFTHFFQISTLPRGFYLDEVSIGYNAYSILHTGADEHGARWPLFFEAFGERKNPIYIYLLSAIYGVFGYSEWTTRSLNSLCWVVGTAGIYALSCRLFSDQKARLYILLCCCFTPWIFSLSRVTFELIVLYPLFAIQLLTIHIGFEGRAYKWAVVSGLVTGLSIYTESAFHFLALPYGLIVLLCYSAREFRRQQILFMLGAAVPAFPYVMYAIYHWDRLTVAFRDLSYLYQQDLSLPEKSWIFLKNYMGYFSPEFLLFAGDPNRRHHTGFGGEFFASTVILFVVALIASFSGLPSRYRWYLILGVAIAPISAALTNDQHHSLRSVSMSIFLIVLSGYGMLELKETSARGMLVFTAIMALLYQEHYFTVYPQISAQAFESYGFKEALGQALKRNPDRVVLSNREKEQYINLLFFGTLSGTKIPLVMGSAEMLRPGDTYIELCKLGLDRRYAVSPDNCPAGGIGTR